MNKKLFILGVVVALCFISNFGIACSGTWHTCGNLGEFLIQVAQNCPDSGSMQIIDCDAGSITLNYETV